MKRFVIPLIAATVLATPAVGHAQTTGTLSATGIVSSSRSFNMGSKQDLHFGTFPSDAPAVTVDVATAAFSHPGGQRGQIALTFNSATKVTVGTQPLTLVGGTTTISPTYTCGYATDLSGSPGVVTPFECGTGGTDGTSSAVGVVLNMLGLGGSQTNWIVVGGAISNLANSKPAGTYTGTLTVTAANP